MFVEAEIVLEVEVEFELEIEFEIEKHSDYSTKIHKEHTKAHRGKTSTINLITKTINHKLPTTKIASCLAMTGFKITKAKFQIPKN